MRLRMPNRLRGRAFALAGLLWLVGCASEVTRHPVELSAAQAAPPLRYVVSSPVVIELDSGYSRTVAAGTEFVEVGSIRQGRVLKPANSVFTIEGAHMHEAYPVVRDARIVGFYLPVEASFSPLSRHVAFPFQPRGSSK